MKYLYLIIRHMFPRRRWEYVDHIRYEANDFNPTRIVFITRDQFGNIKRTTVKP